MIKLLDSDKMHFELCFNFLLILDFFAILHSRFFHTFFEQTFIITIVFDWHLIKLPL